MASACGNRVYLHLGAPKTGTTYLQAILWNNRDALREAGVLYPGQHPDAHFHAAMDLQEKQFQHDWFDDNVPGAWDRLVQQARQWSGTVVVSHELFCTATPEQIDRAISDLSFAEVHLVCTARDLARQLPAMWQEDVKNRHTLSFEEFLGGVRGTVDPPHFLSKLFWRRQDLPAVLDKWSRSVPHERVHVVTVPPAGSRQSMVWERFAGLVGLEPENYDTTVEQHNRSLGVAEVDLLRRLNHALDGRIGWPGYDQAVKHSISTMTMGSRKARTPIEVPAEDRDWLRDQAEAAVDALESAEYDVVGELSDLLTTPAVSEQAAHPDHADEHEVLDVAVESLAAVVTRLAELQNTPQPRSARLLLRRVLERTVRLCEQHPALRRALGIYRKAKSATGSARGNLRR